MEGIAKRLHRDERIIEKKFFRKNAYLSKENISTFKHSINS